MADLADIADISTATHLDAAIAGITARVPSGPTDVEDCATCGEPLDPARRALGYTRCVGCQERLERDAAIRGR